MFFNEKDVLLLMPNICFYDAEISLRNIFSVSSLCQGQRQFSLSGDFFGYNNTLINMKKDVAQPLHMSVRPKKSLLKSTDSKFFFARIRKTFWEIFLKILMFLYVQQSLCICLLKS